MMPYVMIKYGPYYAHGLIQHRIQKASGLFARLNQLGYEIEIVPVNEINRLSIQMYDREVFRCDIRNLMFNVPHEDDAVCQRAIAAVEEAKHRMCYEQQHRHSSHYVEHIADGTELMALDKNLQNFDDESDKDMDFQKTNDEDLFYCVEN